MTLIAVFALFALFCGGSHAQAAWGTDCCNGNYCPGLAPDVAALQSKYPPTYVIAQIVDGDDDARALFENITGDALNSPPNALVNGSPSLAGYNAAADPLAWWSATGSTVSKVPGIQPDVHTCSEAHTWGLSVDDGPTCAGDRLYDFFIENGQQASLFYIGSALVGAPSQARKALAAGFEICVHTWSHHPMTTLTNEQIFAELYYTKMLIYDILNVTTRCWRAPTGDIDDRVRTIAHALELESILWDNDTNDWQGNATGEADYAQILSKDFSQHGTIVLQHELTNDTVALWIEHYSQIKHTFANIVPAVSGCGNITNPYADIDAPTYPTFNGTISGQKGKNLPTGDLDDAQDHGTLVMNGQADFAAMLAGQPGLPTSAAVSSASGSAGSPTNIIALASSGVSSAGPTSTSKSAASTLCASSALLLVALSGLFLLA